MEAPPHPPVVRPHLPLGWAYQAAASPLGQPLHLPKAFLESDVSDRWPLHFTLVQDLPPQGVHSDCRPEGSTLERNNLCPCLHSPDSLSKSGPRHLLGRVSDLSSSIKKTSPRPLTSATKEGVAALGGISPSLQKQKPQASWGRRKQDVAGQKPIPFLEQFHWRSWRELKKHLCMLCTYFPDFFSVEA